MQKYILSLLIITLVSACKQEKKEAPTRENLSAPITYAEGFSIEKNKNHTILHITNPWPGAEKTYSYALIKKGNKVKNLEGIDAIVEVPIKKMVETSTTHIPSLEMLEEINSLVGFPNLNYISSEKTRKLIDSGAIKELGKNEDINTEVLILSLIHI